MNRVICSLIVFSLFLVANSADAAGPLLKKRCCAPAAPEADPCCRESLMDRLKARKCCEPVEADPCCRESLMDRLKARKCCKPDPCCEPEEAAEPVPAEPTA